MRILMVCVGAVIILMGGYSILWINEPLAINGTIDLSVEPGRTPREIAQDVVQAGAPVNPTLLYWWFRFSGQARRIRAGSYELDGNTTPRNLLRKLVQGDEALRSVTIVEGWTFHQALSAIRKAETVKVLTEGWSDSKIMSELGRSGVPAEGRFFPDTYNYSKGASDLAILRRALLGMDRRLQTAWEHRDPGSPLANPDQALTLASIVEKETGQAADRTMVSAVFNNRLRIGMRLQTDPTVIYGLGDKYDGTLHRSDLDTDTAWNTYTRAGLPVTPIALPGKASLWAALHPASSAAMYFVARGDGSSQFSNTLQEHNLAVSKYQRNP